jgi:hypothetical protein
METDDSVFPQQAVGIDSAATKVAAKSVLRV